jgi:threonine/homoserine/homoserine lactone efflux protein
MKEDDLKLARLENERARLAQEIASHERQGRQMAWIALPLATIVVIFIAAAIVAAAGQRHRAGAPQRPRLARVLHSLISIEA